MYNEIFNLNQDSKLDALERGMEFVMIQTVAGIDEDMGDTSKLGEMQ